MSIVDTNQTALSGRAPASAHADTPLYSFDCRRADGAPICLEAHELKSDAHAIAWARKLLREHLTCSSIEIFEGDRMVGAVARKSGAAKGPSSSARG